MPVPNVVGMKRSDGVAALQQAGLVPDVFGPNGPNRRVIGTNPAAGTTVRRGSKVEVDVL